jgi:hypothetical protein
MGILLHDLRPIWLNRAQFETIDGLSSTTLKAVSASGVVSVVSVL